MQYLKWTQTGLIFMIMNRACCQFSSTGRFSKQTSCIGLVATRHFESNSTVAVLATDFEDSRPTVLSSKLPILDDSVVQLLSQSTQFSLVTLKADQNNSYCLNKLSGKRAVDYYVFAGSLQEVVDTIGTFCFDKLTHDHTYFVLFLAMKRRDVLKVVGNVLELFWRHQHQNVIVLADGQYEYVDVYTWFPLEVTPQVEIINQCDGLAFRKNKHLFPAKVPRDLNGRKVNVGLLITPPMTCDRIGGGFAGPQVTLLQSMAKTLNFTAVYITPNKIRTQTESEPGRLKAALGPWKTIFRGMLAGEVSIAIGGFVLWPALLDDFSFIQTINQEDYSFFVTDDLNLTSGTEELIWVVALQMVSMLLVTALVMHALAQAAGRKQNLASTAMMMWSLLTDTPSRVVPNLSARQVLLWTLSVFYAININSAYRSILTASLAKQIYVETIETLTDMVQSDLPVLFIAGVDATISGIGLFSSDEVSQLEQRISLCHEQNERCLLKVISNPQYCWTTSSGFRALLEVVSPNQKYHSLAPVVGIAHNSFYTKKNFYLTRKMSMILLRAAQAGLLDYWYTRFLRNYKICDLSNPDWMLLRSMDATKPASEDSSDKYVRSLRMTNLYSPFHLLGCGLVLAMLVLVFEVLAAAQVFRAIKSYFTVAQRKQLIPLQYLN